MKLLAFILIIVSCNVYATELKHKDAALETNGIKVEFYESSQTGIIKPSGCSYCILKEYKFDKNIMIFRQGKPVTIDELLKSYWKAKYPTLFINLENNQVIKVNY